MPVKTCKYCGKTTSNLYVHKFTRECLEKQPEDERKKNMEKGKEFKRKMCKYALKRYHEKNDNAEHIYCEKCRSYFKPASKKAHEHTKKHTRE